MVEFYRGSTWQGDGAEVKRTADNIVFSGKEISCAHSMYTEIKDVTKVRVFYIDSQFDKIHLLSLTILSVVGVMKVHKVYCAERGSIYTRDVTCYCETQCPGTICPCYNPMKRNILKAKVIVGEPVGEQVVGEPVGEQVVSEPVGEQVFSEPVGEQVISKPVGIQVVIKLVGEQVSELVGEDVIGQTAMKEQDDCCTDRRIHEIEVQIYGFDTSIIITN